MTMDLSGRAHDDASAIWHPMAAREYSASGEWSASPPRASNPERAASAGRSAVYRSTRATGVCAARISIFGECIAARPATGGLPNSCRNQSIPIGLNGPRPGADGGLYLGSGRRGGEGGTDIRPARLDHSDRWPPKLRRPRAFCCAPPAKRHGTSLFCASFESRVNRHRMPMPQAEISL